MKNQDSFQMVEFPEVGEGKSHRGYQMGRPALVRKGGQYRIAYKGNGNAFYSFSFVCCIIHSIGTTSGDSVQIRLSHLLSMFEEVGFSLRFISFIQTTCLRVFCILIVLYALFKTRISFTFDRSTVCRSIYVLLISMSMHSIRRTSFPKRYVTYDV